MMVIPVVVLLLLIVSFMSKVPGASKRAGILLGLVVLQVVLGIASHGAPAIIVLHVLNAFVIFVLAAVTAYHLGDQVSSRAVPAERVSV
jgi:heme A synthase